MPRDEVQAAYFALLRAREELDALQRYGEYLEAERARMRAAQERRRTLTERVPPKLLRALRHTDDALDKALELRRAVIDDELRRLPDRIDAARAFVAEAEAEHEALKRSA